MNAASNNPPQGPESGIIPLRRNRNYVMWLIGEIAFISGNGIGMFAFPLVALHVTGSFSLVGTIGLIEGIGGVVGIIPGGIIADRMSRRMLRQVSMATFIVLMGILSLVLVTGWASAVLLAVLAFLDRLRATLFGMASTSLLKDIVPAKQLPRAFAINQGRDAAIGLGTGPVAGLLLAVNLALPAVVNAVGGLIGLVASLFLDQPFRPTRQASAQAATGPRGVLADIKEALVWIKQRPICTRLMLMSLLVGFGISGSLLCLMLGLAAKGVPSVQIGLIDTAVAAGALLGAFAASPLLARLSVGHIIWSCFLIVALMLAVGALAGTAVTIAAMVICSLIIPSINAGLQGFFVHLIPSELQGRIGAVFSIASMMVAPLVSVFTGFSLAHLNSHVTFLIFALVVFVGFILALGKPLRAIPHIDNWSEYAEKIQASAAAGSAG